MDTAKDRTGTNTPNSQLGSSLVSIKPTFFVYHKRVPHNSTPTCAENQRGAPPCARELQTKMDLDLSGTKSSTLQTREKNTPARGCPYGSKRERRSPVGRAILRGYHRTALRKKSLRYDNIATTLCADSDMEEEPTRVPWGLPAQSE